MKWSKFNQNPVFKADNMFAIFVQGDAGVSCSTQASE